MDAREAAQEATAARPTFVLLALWEVTECEREDFARAGAPYGVNAAAEYLGYIIDELDHRYPMVTIRWHAMDDAGHHCELLEMFREAYREEIGRA